MNSKILKLKILLNFADFFNKYSPFCWVSLGMLTIFLISRICYDDNNILARSQWPTRIHDSIDSETAIQCCFLKYNHVLESNPNVKAHVKYKLLL